MAARSSLLRPGGTRGVGRRGGRRLKRFSPPQPVPPFVPRRAGGAEGGDRPLAALCELGRLRLPAQPVCKVPVGALLVAAGEGGEAGARVCLAPARSQRDGALAVLERRGPPSEPRVRGRAVRVQRLAGAGRGEGWRAGEGRCGAVAVQRGGCYLSLSPSPSPSPSLCVCVCACVRVCASVSVCMPPLSAVSLLHTSS